MNIVKLVFQNFSRCSLETEASLSISANALKENWHSVDLDFAFVVDIVFGPEGGELVVDICLKVLTLKVEVSGDDLGGSLLSVFLGHPEVSGWETVLLALGGVGVVHRSHESIISLGLKSVWGISYVGVITTESGHVSWVAIITSHHHVGLIIRRRG